MNRILSTYVPQLSVKVNLFSIKETRIINTIHFSDEWEAKKEGTIFSKHGHNHLYRLFKSFIRLSPIVYDFFCSDDPPLPDATLLLVSDGLALL